MATRTLITSLSTSYVPSPPVGLGAAVSRAAWSSTRQQRMCQHDGYEANMRGNDQRWILGKGGLRYLIEHLTNLFELRIRFGQGRRQAAPIRLTRRKRRLPFLERLPKPRRLHTLRLLAHLGLL